MVPLVFFIPYSNKPGSRLDRDGRTIPTRLKSLAACALLINAVRVAPVMASYNESSWLARAKVQEMYNVKPGRGKGYYFSVFQILVKYAFSVNNTCVNKTHTVIVLR